MLHPPMSAPAPPLSQLHSIPTELLEQIILHALHLDNLGPPFRLSVYLSLSKTIYLKLANNPAFYHKLFIQKYDLTAPLRRFGRKYITSHSILSELKLRSALLVRIRNFQAFPYPPGRDLEHDLWKIVLMLLESDGLNEAQLFNYANLPRFISLWSAQYLVESHRFYPPENAVISLGLYILWRVQDPETVQRNALSYDNSLIRVTNPYTIAAFKVSIHYLLTMLSLTFYQSMRARSYLMFITTFLSVSRTPLLLIRS
jgi:hypothetical protein